MPPPDLSPLRIPTKSTGKILKSSTTMKLLFVLSSLALASALDVEISDVTCDSSLPISADIILDCNGSSRCTFGGEAMVYGTMFYNGVEDSGVVDNTAYATAELSLFTLNYNLFEDLAIPLCDESMTANEGYECPADGSYNYAATYNLPSAGAESQSWLASGWQGSGTIQLFAAESGDTLIGECTLSLSTFVTTKSGSKLQTPAASVVFGVLAAVLVAALLLCVACCCCKKKRLFAKSADPNVDKVMDFRRMTEDSKTPAFTDPEVRIA